MDKFYGACGVEGCDDCYPLFDEGNNAITDTNGNYLELPNGWRWATPNEIGWLSQHNWVGAIGVRRGGTDDSPDVDYAVRKEA